MTGEGLTVTLTYESLELDGLQDSVEQLAEAGRAAGAELDKASSRIDRLLAATEAQLPQLSRPVTPINRPPTAPATIGTANWSELSAKAEQGLRDRGIDPEGVDLDALLDPEEVQRLNRRHHPGFKIRADLDASDIAVAVAAGLVAAILDVLIVRIPDVSRWWNPGASATEATEASTLTPWLRDHAIASDNALAGWAKTAFDRISNLPEPVAGLGGRTHRVQTLGHDPLLGLIFGTRDIMRGTMTAIPRNGGLVVMDIAEPITNPLLAFTQEIVHLLSDVFTHDGLPLPGWVGLATIPIGEFGPRNQSAGSVARSMYLNGYDSWHLLTMMTSVAALEITLRSYWGLRGAFDQEWKDATDTEAQLACVTAISDHPRFAAMSLTAHAVAAAANLGKIAFTGGNPLALNSAEWVAFVRAFYKWAQLRLITPTTILETQARMNAIAAASGWGALDFTARDFPTAG